MSFQSTAAKKRITGAEHEAAMKKAKFCYVILSNTFKGAAGVFSKELVKAASIKDKKKRRSALDTVTSQVIDELMTRMEASMKKYAANKKKATASYGAAGGAQYDRNYLEQAIASSLEGRKVTDYEPFRVDSLTALAANGIYGAIIGTFFQAMSQVREKAGDFGYFYALGDLDTLAKMFAAAQTVFLEKMDAWSDAGATESKPAAGKKPASSSKPASGKKPASSSKPASGKSAGKKSGVLEL
jgi:hypothetical protein